MEYQVADAAYHKPPIALQGGLGGERRFSPEASRTPPSVSLISQAEQRLSSNLLRLSVQFAISL